jgi:ComF family protein
MLIDPEEAWYGLCGECKEALAGETAAVSINRCDLCGRPLVSENERCMSCRHNAETELPFYDRMAALFPYYGKYQKLLGSFKFGKSLGVGHFLADCLVHGIKLLPLEEMRNSVLVPVPPRAGKIRKTGWDQIAALSNLLKQRPDSLKLCSCLKRQVSQAQKKLDRKERQTNLKDRILVRAKVPKECILFDDVITTGATMNACAAALKAAGAERIFGICLFYD